MKTETIQIWDNEEYSYEHAFGFVPKITAFIHEGAVYRPCILVVPGGAYRMVSPAEAEVAARKFYDKGYQAFVLTYTINPTLTVPLKMQPLKDISRAVRLIRSRADEFGIMKNRLAVCGFSAGGHLCASLAVHYDDIEDGRPEYRGIPNRPDAIVLCYPVITFGKYTHQDTLLALLGENAAAKEISYMSLEKHVSKTTPPAFIWTTACDDLVPPENSELFAAACRKHKVPYALHEFSSGGHGLSTADLFFARGKYMGDFVQEQLRNVCAVVEEKKIAAPYGIPQPEETWTAVRDINREVAVWTDLASDFLRMYL